MQRNDYLLISTCYSFVCGYRSLIRSRSNQGQDQIEFISKERYSYASGLHLNQMRSCFLIGYNGFYVTATGMTVVPSQLIHICKK